MSVTTRLASLGLFVATLASACAPAAPGCPAGASQACQCTDGRMGAQICNADGTAFGACTCSMVLPPMDRCARFTTCATCTPENGCGFCAGRCITGTQVGPSAGSCNGDRWRWLTTDCGATGCVRMTGALCNADVDCCLDGTVTTRCAGLWGLGQVCAARCTAHGDCRSGCCVSLTDGTRVCSTAASCRSITGCTVAVDRPCSTDSECCAASGNRPTACAGFGGSAATCRALCSANADCASACCRARSDNLRVCAPASECAP